MGAVRLAFRAELRRRWRSWLTIALLIGFIGAIAIAYALSPLTPIGEAAVAEPDPGLAFDSVALLLGALAALSSRLRPAPLLRAQ